MTGANQTYVTTLSKSEIEACRKAFSVFDTDGSGTIDVKELKATLEKMGQNPSEEELFVMISTVDEDGSNEIEFHEFLKVIEHQKQVAEKANDETDTIEAFVALGGQRDKTGSVSHAKLANTIAEFELKIDMDAMLGDLDQNSDGNISYEEFKALLSADHQGAMHGHASPSKSPDMGNLFKL